MANKAKHAFGMLENVDSAISSGKINEYDVLFVKDSKGKPYVGWVDKDGNKVICDDSAEFSELEKQIANKANAEEVNKAISDSMSESKKYTDGKVEAAISEHLVKKYEISHKPEGTLVNYGEKEIRVMCPVGTVFTKQSVGSTGNPNMYYMGFKAYAPEGAVSFKEGDKGVIVDEMFTFDDDFAGTDEFGRNYSIVWLALASYDEKTDTWNYYGKNSTKSKYIGWTYCVEWYNEDGIVVESDSIRINLSNEECHSAVEPYYVGDIIKTVDTKIEEKILEVESAIKIVEF